MPPQTPTPDPPAELDAAEQVEWQRITALLAKEGLLDKVDRAMLTAYCVAWARWWRADRQVAASGGEVVKSPSGYPIQNPWLSVANGALRQLTQIAAQFGLSPAGRRRLPRRPAQPTLPHRPPTA